LSGAALFSQQILGTRLHPNVANEALNLSKQFMATGLD